MGFKSHPQPRVPQQIANFVPILAVFHSGMKVVFGDMRIDSGAVQRRPSRYGNAIVV